eukprot:5935810-Pyramimonas_sp.AAC.1
MAMLAARLFQSLAKHTPNPSGKRGITCAQLFVDVMTAFYSSIRELVMKTTLDRQGIAQLILKA